MSDYLDVRQYFSNISLDCIVFFSNELLFLNFIPRVNLHNEKNLEFFFIKCDITGLDQEYTVNSFLDYN